MTGVGADTPPTAGAHFHESWVAALAELELDVERAENLLRANVGAPPDLVPWIPPTGIGTLPLPLLERARLLHRRQLEVAEKLLAAIAGNRRQAAIAEAIDSTHPAARPVFIDNAC